MTKTDQASPQRSSMLFSLLAYFGVVPFIVGIAMEWQGVTLFGVGGRLWFCAYSAVILSFLCGIWWAGALNRPGHPQRYLLAALSNVICLFGWVALMLYATPLGLPMLALAFLAVLRLEARLNPNRPDLHGYFRSRTFVTYLVIACHLLMIGLLGWR